MWNIYLKRGTIWSVKSINQYEQTYEGMNAGSCYVLILSVYTDQYQNSKFTYIKLKENDFKKEERDYISIIDNENKEWFVDFNTLFTGDQRALELYKSNVDDNSFNIIIKEIKNHFNLNVIRQKQSISKEKSKEEFEIPQQRIYKFGIDVYVTENEHVKVNSKKQIILTKEAKDDIIYNSQTDDQIRILCDKYKIYPLKAIKEIRNRLVYQHKQNEG